MMQKLIQVLHVRRNYEKADECEVVFRPDGLPAARTKAEINDGGIVGEGQR
jgi:hypothetical protein